MYSVDLSSVRDGAESLDAAELRARLAGLKVAIVHDQLYTLGGAEKVLKHICDLFPDAQVYSLFNVLDEAQTAQIMGERNPRVTFVQRLPQLRRLRKFYFPLMPLAIEQLDLNAYDLVISSSYMVAKGVIVAPDQDHICYLHSPMRYAWDQQSVYTNQISPKFSLKRAFAQMILHYMRIWDARSSNGVDLFLANSAYVARRAMKAYRRRTEVLYPPVDVAQWRHVKATERDPGAFVTMSRLVEGKRLDLLLDAFRLLPDRRLYVIGDGAQRAALEAAAPPNVTFLGRLSDEEARARIAGASAFVYAAEEDFGIAPVEAQAAGTPVVAFGRGGTAETVRDLTLHPDQPTGVLYARQRPEDIAEAVETLRRNRDRFTEAACRANAERFSIERFETGLMRQIVGLLSENVARDRSAPRPAEEAAPPAPALGLAGGAT